MSVHACWRPLSARLLPSAGSGQRSSQPKGRLRGVAPPPLAGSHCTAVIAVPLLPLTRPCRALDDAHVSLSLLQRLEDVMHERVLLRVGWKREGEGNHGGSGGAVRTGSGSGTAAI